MIIQTEGYLDKSKLKTYLACPYRYYLEYVKQVKKRYIFEAELGQLFHQATDFLYKYMKQDLEKLKDNIDIENYIVNILSQALDTNIKKVKVLIENFSKRESDRWFTFKKVDINKFFPLYSEVYFADRNNKLEGTIDRIFQDLNDEILVYELKTGKYPSSASAIRSIKQELAFYKIICDANEIEISKGVAYFPLVDKTIITTFDDKLIKSVWDSINMVRSCIQNQVFPKKISSLCKYCSVSDYCLFDSGDNKEGK